MIAFIKTLNGVSLKQLVKCPTGNHILDLVLTNGDRVPEVEVGENLG